MAPIWDRRFYIGKALQYAEAGMLEWIWQFGGVPAMLPVLNPPARAAEVARHYEGLVLSGGVDVSPQWYGEEARRPEWAGDPERDAWEIALLEAFIAEHKPVLGICRGHQVINVAMGGSLHQDLIEDGVVDALHRDPEPYDQLRHAAHIVPGSWLHGVYGVEDVVINTVHHQAIRQLGRDLEVMARSDDGVIEAVRLTRADWVIGVQWHPEWVSDVDEAEGVLSSTPLFESFLARAGVVV